MDGRGGRVRRWAVVGAALALGLGTACSSPSSTPAPAPAPPASSAAAATAGRLPGPSAAALAGPTVAALQAELDRWVAKSLLTGATAAVVTDRGSWTGATGVDGAGTRLVPQAGMAVASITKTFVSAAVLRLVEEGEVDLDEAASTYVDHPLLARGPTVRQLLSMRSGLPSVDPSIVADLEGDPDRHWGTRDVLARITSAPLRPGVRFVYENVNYLFLGLVVEEVTGRPLAEVLRAELWDPLGLERIAFQDAQTLAPPRAVPGPDDEVPDGLVAPATFLPWRSLASAVGASGSVAADATTTARWGYLLYGGHVLGEATTLELRASARASGYGLGAAEIGLRRLGTEVIGHGGDLPGFKSVLAVMPERRVAIAILTTGSVEPEPYVAHLARAGGFLPGSG